jgi:hypothetical protein
VSLASIKCTSVGLDLNGTPAWISTVDYDGTPYVTISNLECTDNFKINKLVVSNDASINGNVKIKNNVTINGTSSYSNALTISSGNLQISSGNLLIYDPSTRTIKNIIDLIRDIIEEETSE